MRKSVLSAAMACLFVVMMAAVSFAPAQAFAASNSIYTPTKAVNAAYARCLNVAMGYLSNPTTTVVDISDLKLSQKEAQEVEDLLWGNGELWWINVFGLQPTAKSLTITCKYDDATITAMRKKFESAVAVALKRIGPGMDGATKVHMLHDWIITQVKYHDAGTGGAYKNAYDGLVNRKADCFGFTLVTDVLMRRAGFSTDVAYTSEKKSDHSWNLVKLGSSWYHVDTTWDRWYTYSSSYYSEKNLCHSFLLQSDKLMGADDHKGWKAHHNCTSEKYSNCVFDSDSKSFVRHCTDYKSIVRSFSKDGLKYTVTGVGKVSVASVNKKLRKKAALVVPATVTYKSVKYTVNGIKANAFKTAKAKTLYVQSTSLSKARVANSLVGSKLKTVRVLKGKLAAYKKIFAKANSGRKVSVKGMAASTLRLKAASLG